MEPQGWPLMGSSLTSGGNLRQKTSCLVCHTCTPLVVVHPLPRQHILLIKPLKIRSVNPSARKSGSSLRKELYSRQDFHCHLRLGTHLAPCMDFPASETLLQTRGGIVVCATPRTEVLYSMLDPDPFFEHVPVGFDLTRYAVPVAFCVLCA